MYKRIFKKQLYKEAKTRFKTNRNLSCGRAQSDI